MRWIKTLFRAFGVAFLLAVLAVVLLVQRYEEPMGGAAPTAATPLVARPQEPQLDKVGAWCMAEDFVKQALKSPSTASFGGIFSEYQSPNKCVTALGDNRYMVLGWVDAQNSFGAKIRSNFKVVVRDIGGGSWRCEDIVIVGR